MPEAWTVPGGVPPPPTEHPSPLNCYQLEGKADFSISERFSKFVSLQDPLYRLIRLRRSGFLGELAHEGRCFIPYHVSRLFRSTLLEGAASARGLLSTKKERKKF